jgi:diacylglycerol O-acyltransferase
LHHALIDGVTGARMMAQSLSPTAVHTSLPVWAMNFARHPTTRKPVRRRAVAEQIVDWVRAGRDILPGIGGGLWDMVRAQVEASASGLPFQAPPSPLNVEISGSRRFAAQSYSLSRFKRIGQAAQATVNDVTLAVCAGALRLHLQAHAALPAKPLVAMVPVSLHDQTDAGGNQVSLLLASLATHIEDPLERLQAIVESTREAKQKLSTMPRLQKLAHGITSISGMGPAMVTGVARKHPLFNVVISNVPGPREELHLNGAHLDEVYPVSIATHYLALNITISGYADRLGFGFIACRRSVPALQRMLDYTEQSLAALEQALGIATSANPRKACRRNQSACKESACKESRCKESRYKESLRQKQRQKGLQHSPQGGLQYSSVITDHFLQ